MDPSFDDPNHPSDTTPHGFSGGALRALNEALEDPDTDLDAHMATLLAHFTEAIPSLTTVRLTVEVDEYHVTLGARAQNIDAQSSLLIPLLSTTASPSTTAHLLLHAHTPGALVDVAADSAHLLGLDLTELELDAHLGADEDSTPALPTVNAWSQDELSITDRAVINIAVGILYEQNPGYTLAGAVAALHAVAKRDNSTLTFAARRIVTDPSSSTIGGEDGDLN